MRNGSLILVICVYICNGSQDKSVKYGYVLMNPPCNIEHSVYETISETTVIKCAGFCHSNIFGRCGRFVYNQNANQCKLHSTTVYAGTSPTDIKTWGRDIYSQAKSECTAVGYDYDPETNTCLKLIKTTGTTWTDARFRCQSDGGDLISVATKEKWDFVMNYIQCEFSLWIGLKGTQWMTGEVIDPTGLGISTQINGGDNDYPGDPVQGCGTLYVASVHLIQDESCTVRQKLNFLCEVVLT